jgi:hypothetical protein
MDDSSSTTSLTQRDLLGTVSPSVVTVIQGVRNKNGGRKQKRAGLLLDPPAVRNPLPGKVQRMDAIRALSLRILTSPYIP